MINFSVSRPPHALILDGQVKIKKRTKKTVLSLPFLPMLSPWRPLPENSRPLFSFSRRREEGVIKNYLSSSFLFKTFPRTSGSMYP